MGKKWIRYEKYLLCFKWGIINSASVIDAFNDPLLALEAFKKKKSYDLALIDVKMPKMNGFELCKEIL